MDQGVVVLAVGDDPVEVHGDDVGRAEVGGVLEAPGRLPPGHVADGVEEVAHGLVEADQLLGHPGDEEGRDSAGRKNDFQQ